MSVGKFRGLAAALLLSVCVFAVAGLGEAQALKPRGAWSASVSYALDDIVILRGSTWRSKHNSNQGKLPGQTSPTSTAADWELFASGFNPVGTWKSTATYQRNDVVLAANGAVYRALRTNLNKTPGLPANTADWAVFVLRGATGAPGPQGAPGSTAVGDGSTTAPAFKFTSSPDTGMFSPGGGKIALAENGALFLHDIGVNNLALGNSALSLNTTGSKNIAIGEVALGSNDNGSRNIAIGLSALGSNTSGSYNTAIGYLASSTASTGGQNTVLGYSALQLNDVGSNNTAIGYLALQKNTVSGNTAVGNLALANNTVGVNNVATGNSALGINTSGLSNTAVGYLAMGTNSSGNRNTVLGDRALYYNEIGSNNTALGYLALQDNTASANTAVGSLALGDNIGGVNNVALGASALSANTAGSSNTAIGYQAMKANSTGGGNTALGQAALYYNEAGANNTALGYQALQSNTAGGSNIAIGYFSGGFAVNPQNSIFIGNEGNNLDTATIKIGSELQTSTFIGGISGVSVAGSAVIVNANGQLGVTVSSRRYKEDIHPMGAMSDMLSRLRPVSFRYRKPFADGSKPIQYGLIAEEVAEAFPYLAVFNGEGQPETVKYHELPAFLLEGFQEQQRTIAAQAERLRQQQATMAAQAERIDRLEAQAEDLADVKARLAAIEAMLQPAAITAASASR